MESKYHIGQEIDIAIDGGWTLRLKVVNIYDGILALSPIGSWEIYDVEESDFEEFRSSEYGHWTYSYFIN